MTLTDEFKKCLSTISFGRAGWDYEMSLAQRAEEDRATQDALSQARSIWAENPSQHDALRAAFAEMQPLATMREIERAGIIQPHRHARRES